VIDIPSIFLKNNKLKKYSNTLVLAGLFIVFAAIPATVFIVQRSEEASRTQVSAATYTIDQLVTDAAGNNDGNLCDPPASYDWGKRGDGLPSSLGSIASSQITGWGTAQWLSCGASSSGVRLQIQNFKMYGWNGSSWTTYNGQPGDWCAEANPATNGGYTSCSNSGNDANPNWSMPTGERSLHWATNRMSVQSGTRCVTLYYEAKSTGAGLVVNIGADAIDASVQIQPRIFLSRYKFINTSTWTPIGGSSCTESILRSNPPPFLTGGTNPPPPPPPANQVALTVNGNPASLPYSVIAETNVTGDIRIQFLVDGTNYHTENDPPYSLFGDDGSTVFTGTLGNDNHTVVANVFTQTGNTVLATTSINITENITTSKPGDTNGDNSVNSSDLALVLSKWGTNDVAADLNTDGRVNSADLAMLISNWGS
jgi:hypothetical protein